MIGVFLLPYSVRTFLGLQIQNRHRMKKIRLLFVSRTIGGNLLRRILVLLFMQEGRRIFLSCFVVRCVMFWCVALCGGVRYVRLTKK